MGRLGGKETRADFVHIELVLARRSPREEAAPVFICDHMKAGPAARDTQQQAGPIARPVYLLEGNRRHPRRDAVSDDPVQPKTLGVEVKALQPEDCLNLSGRLAIGISPTTNAEDQVAARRVGKRRHISEELLLFVVRIAW